MWNVENSRLTMLLYVSSQFQILDSDIQKWVTFSFSAYHALPSFCIICPGWFYFCVLWNRKRTVEMRYYFSTQGDKSNEQKMGKNEKYVKSVKGKEGYLTMDVYY